MKCYSDGDALCIVMDDFKDLQESEAIFIGMWEVLDEKVLEKIKKFEEKENANKL